MGRPPRVSGRRLSWWQVPAHVRGAVESVVGSTVVDARTQDGGFSPGAAARLRLANGGAAFAKALSEQLHTESMHLYRMEAAAVPHLPAGLPAPRLLGIYDDGEWLALVFEDVDGREPSVPWRSDDLASVAEALTELAVALKPSPWSDAPSFAEINGDLLAVPMEEAAAPAPDLDPWLRRYLSRVAARDMDMAELVGGDALLHGDLRSDNILLTPDGRAVLVDWAWTCNGAPWLDAACFAISVNAEGGSDAEELVRRHPLTRDVPPSSIDVLLLAVGLNFRRASRSSNPELVPGARAWQGGVAESTLAWLRRRVAD